MVVRLPTMMSLQASITTNLSLETGDPSNQAGWPLTRLQNDPPMLVSAPNKGSAPPNGTDATRILLNGR
jgi:hypothetical protein